MTSISDIAKKVGVAKSTVSRVLNNHPHVSVETRRKVLAAMSELDFAPNQVARDLARGKTFKVGVVIPHTRHPYFTHLINGLLDAAKLSDYQLVMMPSDYHRTLERSYLEQLRQGAIDALIFTSRALEIDEIENYAKYGQIVLCEKLLEQTSLSSAYVNRLPSYREMFEAVSQQGLTQGVLLFSRNNSDSATWKAATQAFEEVFEELPLATFGQIHDIQDGLNIVDELIKFPRLEWILATSDDVAAGIREAYQSLDIPCPVLIGQENLLSSKLLGMATIDHQSYQLGKLAFSQALSKQVGQKQLLSKCIFR
ncbi:DNA-binding LacI/PurR family transcriptional regulator [Streptococcus gallinaceus]|uniref:DNA-binding LacI/PurR family transcriptional regulator n=1 Tax=Streptococcus gallinaceus TaxID=165758 RepID=A0ABV2JI44_9STRE|nr:DNA-binding LacI/PurR family transcriptional regulator [Streptococcus gallinaceus]MCP1769474.1 DNA-binding LacI/PurR family transcriptional regulator [Streptococcus gallinaceus]